MSSAFRYDRRTPGRSALGVASERDQAAVGQGGNGTTQSYARVPRRAGVSGQNRAVELYLQLCRLSDTVIALGVLLGVFVIDNVGRLPTGLDDFLGTRVTVETFLL